MSARILSSFIYSRSLIFSTNNPLGKALRDIFEQATSLAPSVILLDEIDSIASKRIFIDPESPSATNARYINDIVNQLLTLLSQDNGEIVVIGTTNNFQSLDPAVVRPGRFDKHIEITLPNYSDRIKILQKYLEGKTLEKHEEILRNDFLKVMNGKKITRNQKILQEKDPEYSFRLPPKSSPHKLISHIKIGPPPPLVQLNRSLKCWIYHLPAFENL